MDLNVHAWGDPEAPPVVCLHGIGGHGRRFRRLAEERLRPAGFRVVAPDLRGHARSPWQPPWSLEAHLEDALDLLASLRDDPVPLVGHSFGGRMAFELLVRAPERVRAAVLLDPALHVEPETAHAYAEEERAGRSYATRAEALAGRREAAPLAPDAILEEELDEHLAAGPDGGLRLRYAPSAAVTMYGELAVPPPASSAPSARALLVAGADSDFVRDEHVDALRRQVGAGLDVLTVPGGHMVYWDAFDETADAVVHFLAD